MLGAIIGDLAGSVFEYDQLKNVKKIKVEKIIEPNSFFSDDTILTMAICKAILTDGNYGSFLKSYALKYENQLPDNKPYFKKMFSPSFLKWAHGKIQGRSNGNGAMMRISPVGFLFDNENDVILNAKLATIPSHNCDEAINSAITIALIIFWARRGLSKTEIIDKLHLQIKETVLKKFNYKCSETIDLCLYCLFTSNSFEECICKTVSYGGDTDTNACIVGSMAEAIFGIPEELKIEAKKHIPEEFISLLDIAYTKIKDVKFLQ